MSAALALLAAALVLAGAPTTGAATGTRPNLSVEASPDNPRQGQIVTLLIRSDRPLASLRASGSLPGVWLEADATGRLFRGLAGIDLDAEKGDRVLRLEGAAPGGVLLLLVHLEGASSGRFALEPLRVDSKYVEPPAEALPRIAEEREKVARVWAAADAERRWTGPFQNPVGEPERDNFGARRVLNGVKHAPHNGVDFAAPAGAPVAAPGPARVALAEDLYFSGGSVFLDHGGGLFTTYFHLSRIDVKAGELVQAGQTIGAVGSTGRVTGPHLHWGARLKGARINLIGLLRLPQWPLPAGGAAP